MKYPVVLFLVTVITSTLLFGQDEGRVTKVDRIDKNMGVYFGLGPSFTLGSNIGDYSLGFNFEAGFLKRSNRILSWGPSISIIGFPYDPEPSSDLIFTDNNSQGYSIALEGGDIVLGSIAFTLKLNIVPVKDDSKISFYVFAKPFIAMSSRSDVYGVSDYYQSSNGGVDWDLEESGFDEWGPDGFPALAAEYEATGGIFIGPGVELFPVKTVAVFAQASFGYTLPITYVSARSWETNLDSYYNADFPMITEGFPSVNIQVGISINF